ncbi:MAG: patatin-like phospholipase family protein [Candidatus Neomarinimicrobiota bacterium]
MTSTNIGLALGGGGARGIAHIGVLQELHKADIKFDVISGTSAGSIIGAMYAGTLDPFWIENQFRKFIKSKLFKTLHFKSFKKNSNPSSIFDQITKKVSNHYVLMMGLNRISIVSKDRLKKAISYLMPCENFNELKIPLKIISTDLNSGHDIITTSGDLVEAVVQSSSIPGFVEPTMNKDKIIVDGGVGMPIPTSVLKDNCKFILAVDISNYDVKPLNNLNIMKIMKRSETITSLRLKSTLSKKADFLIRPNTMGLHWSEFDKFEGLLDCGKISVIENLKKIRSAINQNSSFFGKLKQWLS